MTFSRIVWKTSAFTLNSPRNGLSIAAVRKIKTRDEAGEDRDGQRVELEVLDPEEISQQAVEHGADQDDGPEGGGQTGRDGLEPKPALVEDGIERPQYFGVDDFLALAGGLEVHHLVFEPVEDHVAVLEGDTLACERAIPFR